MSLLRRLPRQVSSRRLRVGGLWVDASGGVDDTMDILARVRIRAVGCPRDLTLNGLGLNFSYIEFQIVLPILSFGKTYE